MAADVRLPDIKAAVKVDTKDVDASLDRVQASTTKAGAGFTGFQKTAKSSIDDVAKSLTSGLGPASGAANDAITKLGSSGALMGAGVAAGAALASVAVAKFALDGAQAFVGLAGEIRNFQRASGASAEDSSRFVAVLDDLGVSSEVGSKAIFKLSREIGEGGKKLAQYGVEVARAKDGTVDTTGTLLNLADAYVKTADPGQRAAMVMNTLGKAGQALVPVLEQGREGLKAFFEGAESGRQIFSQEDLDKARKYELAIDELGDTFRGLKMEGGEALLPFLTSLATGGAKVLEFGNTVKDKMGGAFDTLVSSVAGAVGGPLAQLGGILGGIGGKSDGAKKSTKELAEEVKASAAASAEDARAKAEQAAALDKVTNATLATISSQLSYKASVNTLKDNINDLDDRTREYTEAVEKNGASSKEAEAANRALRDAHLGIEQSAIAAANAAVKLADDQATAAGQSLNAQEKAHIFRNALVDLAAQAEGPTRAAILALADQILGVPDSKTVYIDADTSAAVAAISSLERRLASISASADSTAGAQQFARGLDMGPVRGPSGAAVPIIAHAGEYVVTPAQLADLRNSPSPGIPATTSGQASSAPPMVHTTIVVDRKVLAEATSRGLYEARRP